MMVVAVVLKMLGELIDTTGQNCDLNLRRTGVALMNSVLFDDLLLLFLKHLFHPFIIFVRRRPGKGQVKLPKTRAYSPDSESGSMF